MQIFNARKPARGHMPVKRVINLASVGEKPLRLTTAVPSVLAVIFLAVPFSKFAVTDRFAAVAEMQREVNAVQRQIDDTLNAMSRYGDLADRYAHYTYSDFDESEMTRTDRIAILDMVDRMVMPVLVGSSWAVSENQMVLKVQGTSLESINQLIQKLEDEPLVDYCIISTAGQTPDNIKTEPVVASVTIFFVPGDATIPFKDTEEEENKSLLSQEGLNTLAERKAQLEAQGVD